MLEKTQYVGCGARNGLQVFSLSSGFSRLHKEMQLRQHRILEAMAQPRGLFGSAGLHATWLMFLHYILF